MAVLEVTLRCSRCWALGTGVRNTDDRKPWLITWHDPPPDPRPWWKQGIIEREYTLESVERKGFPVRCWPCELELMRRRG